MGKISNLAIIQARTGASRLPNKVLLPLGEKTVLEHVISQVSNSKNIDELLVATTIEKADLKIVELCSTKGVRVFCGSEKDVLDRYYQAAKLLQPKNVVRITADCPLIDYEIIDQVIEKHLEGNYDYTSNTLVETFPDGLDVEIMKLQVLKEAWKNASLSSDREHVTQYIIKNESYKKGLLKSHVNYGDKRWTIDTEEDYKFLQEVFKRLPAQNQGQSSITMKDVLEILSKEPQLEEINNSIIRNQGLIKSLAEDREVDIDE